MKSAGGKPRHHGFRKAMQDNHLPASCKTCLNEWEQPVALPMDMIAFAKTIKKIRCPKCGGKEITFNFGK